MLGADYLLLYVCEGPVNRLEARLIHVEDLMEGEWMEGGWRMGV